MDPLCAFVLVLLLVTVLTARYRLSPFITLIAAALLFGVSTGMEGEMIPLITSGAGKIFALLGIPIFCGSLIARALRHGGSITRIVSDLERTVRRPEITAGVAGYLLAIPFMCCITPFIVLTPVIGHLQQDQESVRRLLYITAFGSIVSFVLLFPLPVAYTIVTTLETGSAVEAYMTIAIPVSLLLLAGGTFFLRKGGKAPEQAPSVSETPRWKAWAPVAVPVAMIIAGSILPELHPFGNIHIALLAGAAIALVIVPADVQAVVMEKGTKNAGIIIFDLCGAGALGAVIGAGGFAAEVFSLLGTNVPAIFIPFLLAALIQTAQGSRVVTAVVTSSMIAGTSLAALVPPVPLILMIAAGTLVFSYISDPYFWLVLRTTGDTVTGTLSRFTLPQAVAGGVLAVITTVISMTGFF
ncbi:MAG: GntP family permease [Methanomicrobiaceae archaeon]|nr:GntP family permease [Methanomicrobiaceae archaeon]